MADLLLTGQRVIPHVALQHHYSFSYPALLPALQACQAVAVEVEALGRHALAHACHVGRWADISGLVETAYRHFGKIDVLVQQRRYVAALSVIG
jgi:NAD(P)-dependent dehydrogenase (short-subunit alcohol dehydrogenase family)